MPRPPSTARVTAFVIICTMLLPSSDGWMFGGRGNETLGSRRRSSLRYWMRGGVEQVGMLTGREVNTQRNPGLCDTSVGQTAGYFNIEGQTNLHYFYWMFESRRDPKNDPIVLWLTGGPGCSSVLALFTENGPCRVNEMGTDTVHNQYGWNEKANVIWVDQPAGVGFSYGAASDYAHSEDDVAEDLWHFLQAFFEAMPHLSSSPFYIFAESYGGHYAPALASWILKQNNLKHGARINLQGVGLGNGITDPEVQYQWYAEMAYNNTYGIQTVTKEVYDDMKAATPRCVELTKQCQSNPVACSSSSYYCVTRIQGRFPIPARNPYDIRMPCNEPPLCYSFRNIQLYLTRADVIQALGIPDQALPWNICNGRVHDDFRNDIMRNYHELLVPLLNEGIRVLVYAGDADYICNWMGNKAWAMALQWDGQQGFQQAQEVDWLIPQDANSAVSSIDTATRGAAVAEEMRVAGNVRSHNGLTFVQVYQAGHMVPMDQPAAALALLNAFTHTDGNLEEQATHTQTHTTQQSRPSHGEAIIDAGGDARVQPQGTATAPQQR